MEGILCSEELKMMVVRKKSLLEKSEIYGTKQRSGWWSEIDDITV